MLFLHLEIFRRPLESSEGLQFSVGLADLDDSAQLSAEAIAQVLCHFLLLDRPLGQLPTALFALRPLNLKPDDVDPVLER